MNYNLINLIVVFFPLNFVLIQNFMPLIVQSKYLFDQIKFFLNDKQIFLFSLCFKIN